MGTGYTRQSSAEIVDGQIADASDFNNEFNQLQSAFDATAGHSHDGTAGEGPIITVPGGGTGVATLTDGGVLLGSGTGVITATAVLADGEMLVGDGTTDPALESGATLRTSVGVGTGDSPQFTGIELGHATDTTIVRSGAGDITIEGNAVYRAGGTDVAVADGGTGASTLTDGGVLVGSGTGAVTAMAVLADSEMIVGDGTTDPVAESGATLRTSVGVGTGDSPQFTGIELGHATDTTIARASAGEISVEGTQLAKLDGNLQDLDTLGAASSDGEIAVATGAGALAWESGATLRTSVGVGTGDSPVFAGLDVNGGELVLDADGDTSITADTDDQIDIKIAGADDFQMTANTFSVLSGSTLNIDSGATIANSGTATGFDSGLASGDVIPADDGSVGAPGLSFADDTDNGIYRIGADNFGVAVAGALAMEFDPIGAVQMPLQPLVLAYVSSHVADATGDNTVYTISYGTEVIDQNADMSATTFTAPVSGYYQVNLQAYIFNTISSGHDDWQLKIVTSNHTWQGNRTNPYPYMGTSSQISGGASLLVQMDASDTLTTQCVVNGSTKVIDVAGGSPYTYVSIYLVA